MIKTQLNQGSSRRWAERRRNPVSTGRTCLGNASEGKKDCIFTVRMPVPAFSQFFLRKELWESGEKQIAADSKQLVDSTQRKEVPYMRNYTTQMDAARKGIITLEHEQSIGRRIHRYSLIVFRLRKLCTVEAAAVCCLFTNRHFASAIS